MDGGWPGYGTSDDVTGTYDQDEAALILAKVAEMQRRSGRGEGLSLTELEDAAREAGLDGALVRDAAMQVDRVDEPPRGVRRFGASTRLATRARAEGSTDLDGLARRLFAEMADRVGEPGVQHEVGEARVWHTKHYGTGLDFGGRKLSLTLRPVGSHTELVLREDVDREAASGVGIRAVVAGVVGALATFIVGDVLGPIDDAAALAVLSAPVFSAMGWLAGKRWWRKQRPGLVEAQRTRLRALTAEAEAEPAALPPEPAALPPESAALPPEPDEGE